MINHESFSGLNGPVNKIVYEESISWSTDESGVRKGWKLCLSMESLSEGNQVPSEVAQVSSEHWHIVCFATIITCVSLCSLSLCIWRKLALYKLMFTLCRRVHVGSQHLRNSGTMHSALLEEITVNPCHTAVTMVAADSSAMSEGSGSDISDSTSGGWEKIEAGMQDTSEESSGAGSVKCFRSSSTAFKSPSGHLLLAQELQPGSQVLSVHGQALTVTQATHHEREKHPVVELMTRQGIFKVSATQRIALPKEAGAPDEVRRAGELRIGDKVVVGKKVRHLTNVTHAEERTELSSIFFDPDDAMEAFMIPSFGIQSRGELVQEMVEQPQQSTGDESNCSGVLQIMNVFSQLTEADLLHALPTEYGD